MMADDTRRYDYLDALRSILMMLGVVLHTAKIYDVARNWDFEDTRTSLVFDWLARAIHLFRMPAFFIISGFFALLTLQKYGSRRFLGMRLLRLLVPLLSTALILNSVQDYLRHRFYLGDALTLRAYLRFDLPRDWARGDWVVHLWFLNNLIVYSFVAIFLYELRGVGRRLATPRIRNGLARLRPLGRLLPLLAFLALGLRALTTFWPPFTWRVLGITSLYELAEYLPFFLFGMWLYLDPKLQAAFGRVRRWQFAAFGLALVLMQWSADDEHSLMFKIIFNAAHGLAVWLACVFCFALFRRFADRPSPCFRYLSDAAYTVYLFHHLCVVVLGLLLLRFTFSIYLKFALVVVLTLAVTLAIHHFLILRIGVLRLIFNGKKLPPAASRPAMTGPSPAPVLTEEMAVANPRND